MKTTLIPLLLLLASCTDETSSRRALENQGFTDIHWTGDQMTDAIFREDIEPTPAITIGDRVRITDFGVVRKVNLSSCGEALAVLVECESSGDAVWMAPGMLAKVSA